MFQWTLLFVGREVSGGLKGWHFLQGGRWGGFLPQPALLVACWLQSNLIVTAATSLAGQARTF